MKRLKKILQYAKVKTISNHKAQQLKGGVGSGTSNNSNSSQNNGGCPPPEGD